FRLEFGIARNRFGRKNESWCTRRLQQQRRKQQEAFEPADVVSSVLHGLAAFSRLFQVNGLCQRASQSANQVAAAKNHANVNDRDEEQLAWDGSASVEQPTHIREWQTRREQPRSAPDAYEVKDMGGNR